MLRSDKMSEEELIRTFGYYDATKIIEQRKKILERGRRKRANRKARLRGNLTETQIQLIEKQLNETKDNS